jgi:nitrogen fixation protein FixH
MGRQERNSMTKTFKGWHMAVVTVSFFAVIIAVNVTLAVLANTSWTGLVVENGYMASQNFNRDAAVAREQQAVGWKMQLDVSPVSTIVTVLNREDQPVEGLSLHGVLQRPTNENGDHNLLLREAGAGRYFEDKPIGVGAWIADITAEGADRKPVRFVQRIVVK